MIDNLPQHVLLCTILLTHWFSLKVWFERRASGTRPVYNLTDVWFSELLIPGTTSAVVAARWSHTTIQHTVGALLLQLLLAASGWPDSQSCWVLPVDHFAFGDPGRGFALLTTYSYQDYGHSNSSTRIHRVAIHRRFEITPTVSCSHAVVCNLSTLIALYEMNFNNW